MATTELKILAQGLGWMIIDKEPGISVHNDPEGRMDVISLALSRLEKDKGLCEQTGWQGKAFAPSPVHRLDRETSGLLLLATRKEMATKLQVAFENRATVKIYEAIVRGSLKAQSGRWTYPLSDKAEGRRAPAGATNLRKECVTSFKVTHANPYLTQLEVELGTGRQHQIRRHAVLAGHEVAGDKRYGDPKYNVNLEKRFGFSRLMLHAKRLEIPELKIAAEAVLPVEFERMMIP